MSPDEKPSDSSGQSSNDTKQHKNDIYGNLKDTDTAPAVQAATVVLLRDTPREDDGDQHEVLMLKKNSKIAFGGMWVFPGGRIDDEDYPENRNLETAARTAAAREAAEEASIQIDPEALVWFAHWTPPPSTRRRFETYFFIGAADAQSIKVDGGEILEHTWLNPGDALMRHAKGEIDLAPPTWVTLYHLSRYSPTKKALEYFKSRRPDYYATHVAEKKDGTRVAMWLGDAGYESGDADLEGARHRLEMTQGGFKFEHPEGDY